MKKNLVTTLAIVSACMAATTATAAELDGSVSLGGSYSSIHGNKAKANEYRAIGDGGNANVDLNYRTPDGYFDANANLTIVDGKQADQTVATDNSLKIKGGMSDLFKISLFYDEIAHNITNDAKTYFNGVGTNVLSSTLTAPAATTQFNNLFDYSTKRTNYGAEAELSLKTPFFFLARVDQTDTKGLQPFDYSTSLREIPAPIDYTTSNLFLQTGYRSNKLIATIDGTISNFNNQNPYLTIIQGATTGYAYLPPDNQFYKIGGSVMYRMPFWNTTFMARANHSIMDSNLTLIETANAGTNWNGEIINDSVTASITSNPLSKLDVRLHYDYFNRDNRSDQLTGYSLNSPVTRYAYHKQNAGLDLGYKLPLDSKISAGYEYAQMYRNSFWTSLAVDTGNPEADRTTNHTVYTQIKNDSLDWLSAKLRYEHQFQNSNYPGLSAYATTDRSLYFREYESADKNMDAIKTELEFEPMHGLSLGLQYAFKMNKYTNSPLGMQDDTRHEFYADVNYALNNLAKLNIYGELETVETNGLFYAGNTYGAAATTNDNFFWTTKRKDLNYAFGGKVDTDIIKDKLSASIGYRYERADGSNDFTVSNPSILVYPVTNVTALDDYIKHSLNSKLTYKIDKNISFDFGYLYEHLKYTDDAYTGYTNRVAVTGTTIYAFTGAYNNPNYDASVFYTKLNVKF